jgi:hypothetical protein
MTSRISRATTAALTLCLTLVLAASAAAQNPPGQVKIETIQSGWVVAPDVRFTQVDDRTATFLGATGGWQTERTVLIGFAGYWLVNRDDDFKMDYFGPVFQWTFNGERKISLSARALVGGGWARLSATAAEVGFIGPPVHVAPFTRGGRPVTTNALFLVDDGFFITEPEATVNWSITRSIRLSGGVSYRVIAASDFLDDRLRGPAGTISVQFGY